MAKADGSSGVAENVAVNSSPNTKKRNSKQTVKGIRLKKYIDYKIGNAIFDVFEQTKGGFFGDTDPGGEPISPGEAKTVTDTDFLSSKPPSRQKKTTRQAPYLNIKSLLTNK